jgi:hypothetical protein
VGIMTAVADNYTGHVETQTAARRTLPGVSIIKMCSWFTSETGIGVASDTPTRLPLLLNPT